MKKVIEIVAIIALFLYASASKAAGNSNPSDTTDFIVNGLILQKNKKIDQHCKLELFHENSKIDSRDIRFNKPFEYKLKKNIWYTIRITREGCVPLLISFNTEMKDGETINDNLFAFETELIDVKQAQFLDKDLLDFPVGLVAFNKENGKFEARDIYTQNYMIGLSKPIQETPDITKEYITRRDVPNTMC
jgi:hypothetical protein